MGDVTKALSSGLGHFRVVQGPSLFRGQFQPELLESVGLRRSSDGPVNSLPATSSHFALEASA